MRMLRIKPGPFRRIGDRYGHFINGDHFLGRDAFEETWMSQARTNVSKDNIGYTIELAFPGFKKEDINIEINNDILKVSAKREGLSEHLIHQEMANERHRTFELPEGINQNDITAKLENGLLKIQIPQKDHPSHIHTTIKVA